MRGFNFVGQTIFCFRVPPGDQIDLIMFINFTRTKVSKLPKSEREYFLGGGNFE